MTNVYILEPAIRLASSHYTIVSFQNLTANHLADQKIEALLPMDLDRLLTAGDRLNKNLAFLELASNAVFKGGLAIFLFPTDFESGDDISFSLLQELEATVGLDSLYHASFSFKHFGYPLVSIRYTGDYVYAVLPFVYNSSGGNISSVIGYLSLREGR